jgi:hypothetical protein
MLRYKDHKFRASLGYIARPCLKKPKMKTIKSWVCWYIWEAKQKNHELQASPGYIRRPCLKKRTKRINKNEQCVRVSFSLHLFQHLLPVFFILVFLEGVK